MITIGKRALIALDYYAETLLIDQSRAQREALAQLERDLTMTGLHSINSEQRLYVLPCGAGLSTLGFDVAESRRRDVLMWIAGAAALRPAPMETGTEEHFAAYQAAMTAGAAHHAKTGNRCPACLTPELVGREGMRVEVIANGEPRRRFWVGRSTGWLPIHLEIARRDSSGGGGAYVPAGAIVRTVHARR